MIRISVKKHIKSLLCFLFFLFSFSFLSMAESEVIQAIILINRQAELVDLDTEGEVLKRYVAIPDYFSSGRSHKSSLRKGLQMMKDYGYEVDHTLPGSSDLAATELQGFLRASTVDKYNYAFFDHLLQGAASQVVDDTEKVKKDQAVTSVLSLTLQEQPVYQQKDIRYKDYLSGTHQDALTPYPIPPDRMKQQDASLDRSSIRFLWNFYT